MDRGSGIAVGNREPGTGNRGRPGEGRLAEPGAFGAFGERALPFRPYAIRAGGIAGVRNFVSTAIRFSNASKPALSMAFT